MNFDFDNTEEIDWNSKVIKCKKERELSNQVLHDVLMKSRTESEKTFFNLVKELKLCKYIRSQVVIEVYDSVYKDDKCIRLINNRFVADFADKTNKIIYEIDGGYHFSKEQIEKDKKRTELLNKQGYKVIRYTNEEIENDIERIKQELKEKYL